MFLSMYSSVLNVKKVCILWTLKCLQNIQYFQPVRPHNLLDFWVFLLDKELGSKVCHVSLQILKRSPVKKFKIFYKKSFKIYFIFRKNFYVYSFQGSFILYVRKIFRKTKISYPLIRTRTCTYQGVINSIFSEIFSNVLKNRGQPCDISPALQQCLFTTTFSVPTNTPYYFSKEKNHCLNYHKHYLKYFYNHRDFSEIKTNIYRNKFFSQNRLRQYTI